MASFDSLASDLAALKQQHTFDIALVVDRLSSMEDSIHQLLFITKSQAGGVRMTAGGTVGPVPRASNMGGLGRSSIHVAFGGTEMQQVHQAMHQQQPLRSLRQLDTISTNGACPTQPDQLHSVDANEESGHGSEALQRTLPMTASGKIRPYTPNSLTDELTKDETSEKMHLLGGGSVAGGVLSDGREANTMQEQTSQNIFHSIYQVSE